MLHYLAGLRCGHIGAVAKNFPDDRSNVGSEVGSEIVPLESSEVGPWLGGAFGGGHAQ